MKINFNQLDDTKKQLQFTKGTYSVEHNKLNRWVWTAQEFGGVINNIEYVTLSVDTEIENVLYYDDNSMVLKPDCYNVVKLKTSGKSEFSVTLLKPFIVSGDNRILGIKILSISIDNDIIF